MKALLTHYVGVVKIITEIITIVCPLHILKVLQIWIFLISPYDQILLKDNVSFDKAMLCQCLNSVEDFLVSSNQDLDESFSNTTQKDTCSTRLQQ